MRKLVVVFILCLFLFPMVLSAQNEIHVMKNGSKLNKLADQALLFTKQTRYEDAKQLLSHFSEEFMKDPALWRSFDMFDLKIVTTTHEQAVQAVTKATLPHEERVAKLTQFRFAVDALYSEHQPLWLDMKGEVIGSFQTVKAAHFQQDREQFQRSLNEFLSKVALIQPAISLDAPVEEQQRLNAYVVFLEKNNLLKLSEREQIEQLEMIEQTLEALFEFPPQQNEADPSLIWVIVSTGGIIISALFYTGIKKFRAEKQQERVKQRLKD